ncbi:MAG: TAT-variant-translocated molybdopterin oxidoreductase, partial [Candidatus Hydrogenedentes bacterium]|nr:TAT-variant-translocated molybdopterin oxidoreductase [Candidatus Hydrogenedentota bacterium]
MAEPIDLGAVRQKLASKRGPEYWRSLEELAETDGFMDMLHREFPRGASVLATAVERRSFLKCMGASLALAGVTAACSRQPDEHIVPYVKPPAELTPGNALMFATAMPLSGYAMGLLAENHMGRPTKVEGNPHHPASLGSTDIFAQASILSLYDPDRSTVALRRGTITTWETFVAALDVQINGEKDPTSGAKLSQGLRDKPDSGIRLLTGTVTSPTLTAQLNEFLTTVPGARWHQYEPVNRDNAKAGARIAFDDAVNTVHQFDVADVVLSLDSNFLSDGPTRVRYSRDFTSRRSAEDGAVMNRLYVIESSPTLTGATADNHLHARPSQIETFARAIARKLGLEAPGAEPDAAHAKFVDAVAGDLQAHAGKSIIIAGDNQPPIVHAIVHAMNDALGNAGTTVLYTDSIEAEPVDQTESLRTLARDMEAGNVDTLFMIGVNPVYESPADLNFAAALQKVNHRIHMGVYQDETSDLCHWHIPEAHYLESWSDCRAYDGTVTFIQPMIAPLYSGKTAHELLAALFGKGGTSYDIVRQYWQTQRPESFEIFWRESLAKGIVDGTGSPVKSVRVRAGVTARAQEPVQQSALEVSFQADPTIGDGRWANSGWLQELPKPLTRITWDNAVLVSFHTAEEHGISNFDYVDVTVGERTVRGQAWIQPGHPDHVVTLHLGYGRTRAGHVGNNTGYNAYTVRTSAAPWFAPGAVLKRIEGGPQFARTELHQTLTEEHRPLARTGTLAEYHEHPDFAKHVHPGHEPSNAESLYPPSTYEGYAWGMTIDLSKCTGCGVCIIACQAENNIPVVGKEQVIASREMHWIRVDRYYKGDPAGEVEVVHQPVPCMQCENAPCEVVCPVAATVHSKEGLNDMVYNRCVGTRYCSNNCPYKVRRFNFFHYSDQTSPSLQMMYNPDVTVRTRGVMEKCTYCVQRINLARIDAKKEGRSVRDGEITTACQQACPGGAIVFGNQGDPESSVAKLKAG